MMYAFVIKIASLFKTLVFDVRININMSYVSVGLTFKNVKK